MNKKRKDTKKAQRAYANAHEAFNRLTPAQKQDLTTGRAAVAEARFQMAEEIFREFQSLELTVYAYKNVAKYIKAMGDKITARTKLIAEAREVYLEVIEYGSPNWAIAAMARIGQMFQAAANDIYGLEGPGSFDEEQKEVFKGAMAERAAVPESKAVESYVLCLKKAQELRWFNKWSDLAERQLATLKPGEYRYNAEIRARPTYFGDNVVEARYIAELQSEEEEEK